MLSAAPSVATASVTAAAHDLSVRTTATLTAAPGDTIPVPVNWSNAGPAAATGVVISYVPPLGTSIFAGGLPAGWTLSGRTAVRTEARLASGVRRSATIPLIVSATSVPGTLLVGGAAEIRSAAGRESKPADNQAFSRVRLRAAPSPSTTPRPSATPSPSRTPSPTTSPSTAPTAASAPARSPRPATPAAQGTNRREPSLTASTFIVAAPSVSISPDVIEVVDGEAGDTATWLVPALGAITCFTAAGLAGVAMRRRRIAEQAHQDEVRYLSKTP